MIKSRKGLIVTSISIISVILITLIVIFILNANKKRFVGNDYGVDLFSSIDYLAKKQDQTISEQQTSYSRDGGNDDGFGLHNNISGEPDNQANPLRRVLLDLKQPGVVYRMWFTNWGTPPNLRIYIDGELIVDENIIDLTSGNINPFVKPLVSTKEESSGGYVFYVPIVFKESIQIIGSGDFYYNINYQKLPAGSDLESFNMDLDVSKAVKILNNITKDPKFTKDYKSKKSSEVLFSNLETSIFKNQGRNQVSAIELDIPELKTTSINREIIEDSSFNINRLDIVDFKVKVGSSENQLVLRSIIQQAYQSLDVYVGSKQVGKAVVRPRRLDGFEWKDNPYLFDAIVDLPTNVTNGKTDLDIKLVGVETFTLASAFIKSNDKVIDEVHFSNDKSRNDHNVKTSNRINLTPFSLEYDPNNQVNISQLEQMHKDEDIVNNIYINVYYDGSNTPDVSLPISAFFGFGNYGLYETTSLMNGLTKEGKMYSFFPMPYEESIEITLENKNSTNINKVDVKVSHEKNIYEINNYGYFKTNYTVYENGTDTALQNGVPITFLKTTGSGHIVNVTHSMSGEYFGEHSRFYLEGDEQIYIDGQLSHSFHGTGTEDFYNGGWYFNNGVQVNPLFGQSNHNYRDGIDRTVMNRTLITDPIVFRSEIDFKMEHGGWNNRPDSSVYIAVHYYHSNDSSITLSDTFNFTDGSSNNRNYKTGNSTEVIEDFINGRYEGIYSHIVTNRTTKHNIIDFTEFEVKLESNNKGAIIRVLQDLNIVDQEANVYVDGVLVGKWNNSFRSALGGYVRTIEYVIPETFTLGKDKITIRIENDSKNKETTPWTQLEYNIYSLT